MKKICILGVFATMLMVWTTLVQAASSVKVGAILAETGPASFLGGPERRSLEMIVEKLNQNGGVGGVPIELVIKDSAGSSEKAISFARQLIEEEKVIAIIGPSTSGETLKIKKLCEKSRTLLISCSSADLIVKPLAKHVFKTAPSDGLAVRKIFETMKGNGISKIALLSGNTGFGKTGKKQVIKLAPKYDITVLESEVYDKSATDLSSVVAKIKSNKDVEAVINWSVVPAQSIVAKNIRQSGWDIPLYQSHGFANIKYVQAAGAAAEGIIFPASRLIIADTLAEGFQKDFLMNFKTSYEAKYGEEVSTFGGHSYDAMLLLAFALEQVGADAKVEDVRLALESINGFTGTAGEFNLSDKDHSGLDMDAFTMLTVKNGKFVAYEK